MDASYYIRFVDEGNVFTEVAFELWSMDESKEFQILTGSGWNIGWRTFSPVIKTIQYKIMNQHYEFTTLPK